MPDFERRMEFLAQSVESHDRQIGEIMDAIAKFVRVTNEDAALINKLARIAERHDQRLTDPEGGQDR